MKSFRYSLNSRLSLKYGKAEYSYLIPTAVILLIISFCLKTVGSSFLIVAAVLFAIAAAVWTSLVKQKNAILMFIVVILFCVRGITVINTDISNAFNANHVIDNITATVTSSSNAQGGYCVVTVNNSQFEEKMKGKKVLLPSQSADSFNIGDIISSEVKYRSDFNNPESFYSDGIYLAADEISNVKIIGKSKGIYGFAGIVRDYSARQLVSYTDNYHVLLAVSTGERGYVSDKLYDSFKDAGVSHVLVVSGMHLVLICGALDHILRLLCRKSLFRDLVLLSFVFIMCGICGFGISIIRAGLVYVIKVIMRRMGRLENSLSSLALSAVIVLFIHPFAFHSVSFQLSYGAVLGIFVFPPLVNKYIVKQGWENKLLIRALQSMAVPLGAFFGTFPTMVATFGRISLVSVPANILVGIPASIMLALCVVGLMLGFIEPVGEMLLCISDILADYFIKIVEFFSSLPFAAIQLKNTELLTLVVLLIYLALYIIFAKPFRALKKR